MLQQIIVSLFCGFLGSFLYLKINSSTQPKEARQNSGLAERVDSNNTIVTAQGFNLVDTQGRLRAQLSFAKDAGVPGLWLMDDRGVARLILGLYQDNTSYIGLQDAQGQMIELMRSFGSQEAPLLIFKNRGQDAMITGLNPGAQPLPFLMSYDAQHQRKIHFGTYEGP